MRFFIQYHNYEKLKYLPSGYKTEQSDLSLLDTSKFEVSCTTTSKTAILSAIGDCTFMVVGYGNKPKHYLLWSWLVIDNVEKDPGDGRFQAYGEGRVLSPPAPLSGPDFDKFLKRTANFSLGFQDVSEMPYLANLIALAKQHGQFDPAKT